VELAVLWSVRLHASLTRSDVTGVITKEHVAEPLADSVKAFPEKPLHSRRRDSIQRCRCSLRRAALLDFGRAFAP
jgi:hypothetical protein